MYKLILMVDMNLEKTIFIIRNKLRFLTVEEVVFKCFDSNYLIARMAILELINRNPTNINLDDSIIRQVINKMTIEDIWSIASSKSNTKLFLLAYERLSDILEYYDRIYEKEQLKEKLKLL